MKKYLNLKFEMAPLFTDIIVTALEGGSNYWCDIREFPDAPKGYSPAERLALTLVNNPKYEVAVYDTESGDKIGALTQAGMIKGIQKAYDEYVTSFTAILDGSFDAGSADVIFQLAVLGEITYG